MSTSALNQSSAATLAVAIIARDSARLDSLRATVHEAGHRVVGDTDADVLLLDGESVGISKLVDKPTLVLSEHDPGRVGWLPTNANVQQIDAALRAVVAGLSVRMASEPKQGGFEELPEQAHALLTPRELDVLGAIGAGHSNKAIARQLGISLHTVKFHIESLLRKLGAHTRAEAVAKGLERRARETVEL
jgi:DNA-binding CsgD family transcriptional regulator